MNKLFCSAAVLLLFLTPNVHFGQAPNLGSAADFALFTAAGAFNSNVATTVTGDIGTNAGAYVPPGVLIGTTHVVDAVSAQAATDVMLAYAQLFGLPCGNVIGVGLGGGQILPNPAAPSPHIYCLGGASTLNGELILDGQGDPNALFIFQINGAFASSVNSKVTLRNGATACNVYWQINGAVSLATGTDFKGTILANGAIHLLGNAILQGRALSTAGEISTEANVVTLDPIPSVIATTVVGAATTFCEGGSVTLGGNTNGGTWCNGANPTASPTLSSIIVTTSGDYFVKNRACGRTVMSNHIMVMVNPLPLAIVGNPVSICRGNSVPLGTTAIAGHTYAWTGAGLNANNIANPIATPLVTTLYTLTETTVEGCQRINNVTITVTMGATGDCIITGNNTICPATTTQLCVPVVAGVSYNWSTVGGTIIGLSTTACITISAAGTYSVTVTGAGLGACVSTCMKTVTVVNPVIPPIIIVTGVTTFCAGGNVTLSSNTNGGIWTTTSATPILMPTANPIMVSTSGIYTLTNTTICESVNTSITVTVNPVPNCMITGTGIVCAGNNTMLCAPATSVMNPLTYSWNTIPSVSTSCIITETAGIYTVTVTGANGCQNSCSKAVIVNPLPTPRAGGALTICHGIAVQLGTAPIAGHTYIWTPAAGLSNPNIANPFALPSVMTTYILTETITATGCQKSDSVVVASYPLCECACQ